MEIQEITTCSKIGQNFLPTREFFPLNIPPVSLQCNLSIHYKLRPNILITVKRITCVVNLHHGQISNLVYLIHPHIRSRCSRSEFFQTSTKMLNVSKMCQVFLSRWWTEFSPSVCGGKKTSWVFELQFLGNLLGSKVKLSLRACIYSSPLCTSSLHLLLCSF